MNSVYNASEPGISMEAAKWLADQKVVLIGSDTLAVEVWPSEDPSDRDPSAHLLASQQRYSHY